MSESKFAFRLRQGLECSENAKTAAKEMRLSMKTLIGFVIIAVLPNACFAKSHSTIRGACKETAPPLSVAPVDFSPEEKSDIIVEAQAPTRNWRRYVIVVSCNGKKLKSVYFSTDQAGLGWGADRLNREIQTEGSSYPVIFFNNDNKLPCHYQVKVIATGGGLTGRTSFYSTFNVCRSNVLAVH